LAEEVETLLGALTPQKCSFKATTYLAAQLDLVTSFQRWHLGKFWRILQCKMLVYFMTIGYILRPIVYFVVIRYILWSFGLFPHFGMLHQEKSGNPAAVRH
jgi:ABC-type enterochelin transport system permease subunit